MAAARVIAAQLAKQGAKKGAVRLSQRAIAQAVNKSAKGGRVVTRATTTGKAVRKPKKGYDYAAGRERARKVASDRLATRNKTQTARAGDKVKINPAALGSKVKSGKPTPNRGGGLRTTTGQGKKKTSREDVYEAVKTMREKPGGATTTTGTGEVRATAPKPYVRVTTRTSGTKGDKPFTSKEKVTVQKPIKKTNPKEKGSAVTIRKGTPRKAADVRAEKAKAQRDRTREALTIRVNPARPKMTPKQGSQGFTSSQARSEEIIQRYYNVRFGDRSAPSARSSQSEPGSINQRINKGVEEQPRQSTRSSSTDYEADKLANRSLSALENPKVSAKETVRPGKRTNVAKAVKTGNARKIAKATANQRRVMEQRQIKEIAERMRVAQEAAKKAGRK